MTEREWTTRALAASDGRFVASADSATAILVLARGRGRAAMFARALPAAIEGVMANPMPAHPGPEIAAWPDPVRSVIAFLGAVHHDLRDSSVAERDPLPVSLDLLIAVVAEGRLYLVAAGSVAAFLRRDGNWELLAPLSGKARLPLGVEARARIEVTSEPLAPGDLLLAVPSPNGACEEPNPDLVAALTAWDEGRNEHGDAAAGGSFAAFACDAHLVEHEDAAELDLHALDEEHEGDEEHEAHVTLLELDEEVPSPTNLVEDGLPAWLAEPGTGAYVEPGTEAALILDGALALEPVLSPEAKAAQVRAKKRRVRLALAGAGALAVVASFAIGARLSEVWQEKMRTRTAASPDPGEEAPLAPAGAAADSGVTQSAIGGVIGKTAPWQRVVTGAAAAQTAGAGIDRGAGAQAGAGGRGSRADETAASAPAGEPVRDAHSGMAPTFSPGTALGAAKAAPPPGGLAAGMGSANQGVGGGRIEARTEPFREAVTVYVDGKPVGTAPTGIDGIPPGRHVVRFETGDGQFWEEEVTIAGSEVATAVAPLGAAPSRGVVEVIASVMSDEGSIEEEDVVVIIDGKARGTTPIEIALDPGTYGVRIEPAAAAPIDRVVEVRPGDRQVLEFRLDQPPRLTIEHRPATSLGNDTTPILTASVRGEGVLAVRIDLHVMEAEGWTAMPMGQVPGAPGTFAAGLPIHRALHGKALRYYMATASEGEAKVETPIFTVPIR